MPTLAANAWFGLVAKPLLSAAAATGTATGAWWVARRRGSTLAAKLKRQHLLLFVLLVTALARPLRAAVRHGLSNLCRLVANLWGLATGRLAVVRVGGELALVEK